MSNPPEECQINQCKVGDFFNINMMKNKNPIYLRLYGILGFGKPDLFKEDECNHWAVVLDMVDLDIHCYLLHQKVIMEHQPTLEHRLQLIPFYSFGE